MIRTIHAVAAALALVVVPLDARPAPDPVWDLSLHESAASGDPDAWERVFGADDGERDAARERSDCACHASDGGHVDAGDTTADDTERGGPLVPDTQPADERHVGHVLSRLSREVGALAEALVPGDADVGSELAPELVADPGAQLEVADTGADAELRHVLYRELYLDARLQDGTLGEEQLIFSLQLGGDIAVLAHVERRLELEPVRREPLEAERKLRPRRGVAAPAVIHPDTR
jgi:hypothetical protein